MSPKGGSSKRTCAKRTPCWLIRSVTQDQTVLGCGGLWFVVMFRLIDEYGTAFCGRGSRRSRGTRLQNAAGSGGRRDWANAAGCWLRRTGQPERGGAAGPRSRWRGRRRRHAAASRDARSDKQDGSRSLRGQTTFFWLRAFLLGAERPGQLLGADCAEIGCPGKRLFQHNVQGHPVCLARGDARLRV